MISRTPFGVELAAGQLLKMGILVLLLGLSCPAEAQTDGRQAINSLMDQQRDRWNEGSLRGFMEGYWRSDSLMFVGSEITYGYDSTLARYRRRYPDPSAMGQLRFETVSLDFLSEDAALMVGKWFLERDIGDASGHFTLLFRRIDGQWYITKDHSS